MLITSSFAAHSLEYELTNVSTLQDILTALVEPLTAEELNAARTQ